MCKVTCHQQQLKPFQESGYPLASAMYSIVFVVLCFFASASDAIAASNSVQHGNSTFTGLLLPDGFTLAQGNAVLAALPANLTACEAITSTHLRYTLEKIRNASVQLYPYPHMIIDSIFEPSFYECMMQALPRKNSAYKKLFPRVERYEIALSRKPSTGNKGNNKKKKGYTPEPEPGPFWKAFNSVFGSKDLTVAYLQKMHDTVVLRDVEFPPSWQDHLFWNMALCRDITGYEIGPHTDSRGKIVTVLYYLPKDQSAPKNAGTCVVRSKSGRTQKHGSNWASWDDPDFEVVQQAEFIPNSVFVFAACHSSWHAVPRMTQRYERNTIQAFISAPSPFKSEKGPCFGSSLPPPMKKSNPLL